MDFTPRGSGEVKPSPKSMDDELDRKRAPALEKLRYICDKAALVFSTDPRMGGFSFVGQHNIVEQVICELSTDDRKLQQAVVLGSTDGDVVGWWVHRQSDRPIPLRVRSQAKSANLFIMPDHLVIPSTMSDRRLAGEIRLALWRGEIRVVS